VQKREETLDTLFMSSFGV